MEKSNSPRIRFKGFTEPWEQRKLGELCYLRGRIGFRGYTKEDLVPEGAITFSPSDIDEEGNLSTKKNEHITFSKYEESPEIKVSVNDILFTKTASIGKIGFVYNLPEKATINPQFALLSSNTNFIFPYYLFVQLRTKRCMNWAANITGGSSVPTMSQEKLKQMPIYSISLNEEKKIGSLFLEINRLITLHQRKCDRLNKVKQGLLEKMFPTEKEDTPKIRFKGFTEPWEQRKLNELGNVETGNTPSTSIKEYYSEEGLIWITPTDITSNITLTTEKKLSEKGEKVARVIPANSILCTCIASIGKNTFSPVKCAFNQQINALIPSKSNDPYFLFVDSYNWSQLMLKGAGGLTFQIVNKTEFSNIVTFVPSIGEQKKIGYLFYKLDNLITLHQRKCKKLKNIKSALLERMFV